MPNARIINKSLICIFSVMLLSSPSLAQERPYPPAGIKGTFELDLFTQVVSRSVVEETSPGQNFQADAVSTRVIARL